MAKSITTGYISATINGIKVNSSLKCHSSNRDRKLKRTVSKIVFHYTGNRKDIAKSNANYFSGANRDASAHFFVDDDSIYQSVRLCDVAWHVGAYKYYHDTCRNSNSWGIEMCCTAGNYRVSKKTIKNAAYLGAYLCEKLNISADEVDDCVLRHYDVTHKKCPAQMVKDPDEWKELKNMIKDILNDKEKKTVKTSAKKTFIKAVQKACGATVDGIAGPETLSKTVTVSAEINSRHKVVKAIQTYLNKLGYKCGRVDGIAGPKFTAAVKDYQSDKGCVVDGEITAGAKTWQKLLGL